MAEVDGLNSEVIQWATDWSGNMNNVDGTHSVVVEDGTGDARGGMTLVDIDRPEDHLLHLYGFNVAVGDPAADGEETKFDLFVYNNDHSPPSVANWKAYVGEKGDTLIGHVAAEVEAGVDNNSTALTQNLVWFNEPILSTGKLLVAQQSGALTGAEGGELATILYYDYVEVGDNQVLKELLEVR